MQQTLLLLEKEVQILHSSLYVKHVMSFSLKEGKRFNILSYAISCFSRVFAQKSVPNVQKSPGFLCVPFLQPGVLDAPWGAAEDWNQWVCVMINKVLQEIKNLSGTQIRFSFYSALILGLLL